MHCIITSNAIYVNTGLSIACTAQRAFMYGHTARVRSTTLILQFQNCFLTCLPIGERIPVNIQFLITGICHLLTFYVGMVSVPIPEMVLYSNQ